MTWTRREMVIAAAAGGLLPAAPGRPRAEATRRWRGTALGARAEIAVAHADPAEAERLIARARAEVRRLEGVFSLHLADSALARLNAQGRLAAPPFELVELLGRARRIHAATEGAFDPTVQPLWAHYRDRALGRTPDRALADARARVGLQGVRADARAVAFDRPGMALTLNGIAQGAITDRVADLFRAAGLSCLVSLGEQRALGRSPDGDPWTARVPGSDAGAGAGIPLQDQALAVSDPAALSLGPVPHILDPRTGGPADTARRVAVRAPRAADADGFSTAFALLPAATARAVATRAGVELLDLSG